MKTAVITESTDTIHQDSGEFKPKKTPNDQMHLLDDPITPENVSVTVDAEVVTIDSSQSPQMSISSSSDPQITQYSHTHSKASDISFIFDDIPSFGDHAQRQLLSRHHVLAQTTLFAGIEPHELFIFEDILVLTKHSENAAQKVMDWVSLSHLKLERPSLLTPTAKHGSLLELHVLDEETDRTIYLGFEDNDVHGKEEVLTALTNAILAFCRQSDPSFTQEDIYKPLKGSPFSAIIMNDLEMLSEHLNASISPNSMDVGGQPLLSYALQLDNMDAAKLLLKYHASPDLALVSSRPQQPDALPATSQAANASSSNTSESVSPVTKPLQKYAIAQPPLHSEMKTRLLHAACSVLNVSAVKWLVWSGASVNSRDDYMLTPIERAIRTIIPEYKSKLLSLTKETVDSRYNVNYYTEMELNKSELMNSTERVSIPHQQLENHNQEKTVTTSKNPETLPSSPSLSLPIRIGPYEHEWPVFKYEYSTAPTSSPSSPSTTQHADSISNDASASQETLDLSVDTNGWDAISSAVAPQTPIRSAGDAVMHSKDEPENHDTHDAQSFLNNTQLYISPVAQKRNEMRAKLPNIEKKLVSDVSDLDFDDRMERACEIIYFLCTFHSKSSQNEANLANVDSCDQNEKTLLLFAVENGHIPLVKTLLSAGASVSQSPHVSQSALHIASNKNALEIATALLNYGASPNARDIHGNTPLHFASSLEMISLLLRSGARPQLTNAHNVAAIAKHLSGPQSEFIQDFIRSDRELREFSPTVRSDFLREKWLENEKSPICLFCCSNFTFLTRRHHCRRCGLLVCGDCSLKRGNMDGKDERVCDPCYNHLRFKESEATLWLVRYNQSSRMQTKKKM